MTAKQTEKLFTPCLAGFCALALAFGLGRFAYTPILPELVKAHWLSATTAGFVGTMNFVGYLIGAIISKPLTHYRPAQFWIKISLIVCAISLIGCIWHPSLAWFMAWRFLAGLSGAILMVLTPHTIYQLFKKERSHLVAGIIFSGIGVGIIYSGITVPYFISKGINTAWLAVGIAAAVLAVIAFFTLPNEQQQERTNTKKSRISLNWSSTIVLLAIAYALFSIGSVPHFLFVMDYIETVLRFSNEQANTAWILYGITNAVGTPIFGYTASRLGNGPTLMFLLFLATVAIGILFLSKMLWVADLSYALMGLASVSVVSLCSSYLSKLAPTHQLTAFWGMLTVTFAVFQSAASTTMSGWLGEPGGYNWIFGTACIAMFIGGIIMGIITHLMSRHKKIQQT